MIIFVFRLYALPWASTRFFSLLSGSECLNYPALATTYRIVVKHGGEGMNAAHDDDDGGGGSVHIYMCGGCSSSA